MSSVLSSPSFPEETKGGPRFSEESKKKKRDNIFKNGSLVEMKALYRNRAERT